MDATASRDQSYRITPEESQRIAIFKLWLCIMVVFIHSSTLSEFFFADETIVHEAPAWLDWTNFVISRALSQCAVPWFFFLSGLLLYRKPFGWLDNIKKKARTLLVPYVILNTFWILFYAVAQQIPAVSVYFANPDRLVAHFTAIDFADAYLGFQTKLRAGNFEPFLGTLWFVRDLFVLNVLAVAIKKVVDRYPKAYFAALLTLLLFQVRVEEVVFCLSTRGIVFFSLGYYAVKYHFHLPDLDKIRVIPFALAFAASILLACCLRSTAQAYLGVLLVILVGGGFVFRAGTRFTRANLKRKIQWLTPFGFSIYLFHQSAMMMVQKAAARFLPINPFTQALAYFGIPLLMITACVLFSVACRAKCPKLYGLLTGNRG